MTPAEYASIVVLPTVREQLVDKLDIRKGMLSCILTFHIADHIAHAEGCPNASRVCERMRTRCRDSIAEFERELTVERIRSGIAAAKARGAQFGRQAGQQPKSDRLTPKVHRLGRLHDRAAQAQHHRASGLALVTAAIVLWNTTYLGRALDTVRRRGDPMPSRGYYPQEVCLRSGE